jgi:hypothetical protein
MITLSFQADDADDDPPLSEVAVAIEVFCAGSERGENADTPAVPFISDGTRYVELGDAAGSPPTWADGAEGWLLRTMGTAQLESKACEGAAVDFSRRMGEGDAATALIASSSSVS